MSENKFYDLPLEEKAYYLRLAGSMSGIHMGGIENSELIVAVFESLIEKGDSFSLKDGAAIRSRIEEKYKINVQQNETTPNCP